MTTPLVARELLIRDTLGVAGESRITLGRITVISGPNGTGKTTILDSVQAAIGKVSLADLAHRGGDAPARPLVQILLEGGDRYVQVQRDASGPGLAEWSGDAFISQPKPGERMPGLVDALLCNPIRFDRARPEDRLKDLLLALQCTLDQQRVAEIVAPSGVRVSGIPKGLPAIAELDMVYDQVFQARTEVNRQRKQEDHVAARLQPEGAAVAGAEPDLSAAEAALEAAAHKLQRERDSLARDQKEARGAAQRVRDDAVRDSQAQLERELAEAQRAHQARVAAADAELARARDVAAAVAQDNAVLLRPLEEAVAKAREKKAEVAALREEWSKAVTLREEAAAARKAADGYARRSEAMTAVLDALKAYRNELASALPAGLELVQGKLHVRLDNGAVVPYEQANSAARWVVAALVAAERAKQLPWPLIVIDDGEKLDHANRRALLRELARHPVQVLMAVVDGSEHPEPFRVEILDDELQAAAA